MYKRLLFTLITTGCSHIFHGQISEMISIENVSVIPMTSELVLNEQRVIISNGVIFKIEPTSAPRDNNITKVIDGSGKFLIPGLSEMHYHLRSNDIESDLKLMLANGITTVRNMAEFENQDHLTIREKLRYGMLLGPNYFTTGPYLTSKDLQTQAQIITTVEAHKNKGYDFLKIADNLAENLYLKLLEQGQLHNLPIVGHSQRHLPLEYSTRMTSIEHIEEFIYLKDDTTQKSIFKMDTIEQNDLAQKLQTNGIYIGTTLSVFEFINDCLDDDTFSAFNKNPLVRYIHRDQRENFLTEKNDYRKLRDRMFGDISAKQLFSSYFSWIKSFSNILSQNKVNLLTGSDTYGMVIVGFSLHREFELLQEAGLEPYDILIASTVNPARYLKTAATEGTITIGKNANLVLLSKNPLENIKHTQSIEGVMIKGTWLDKQDLHNLLKEVEKAYE